MARTTTIRLLTGDYADRLQVLYDRAREAERNAERQGTTARIGDQPEYQRVREEYEALKAEAEAEAITVSLEAVGRREWRALKEKHPPRTEGDAEVVKSDRLAGVNVDTVEDDLVYASLVEPAFTSRAAFDEWADTLSEAEFQTVLGKAWELANTVRLDPKSLPASLTLSSGES